MRKFARPAVAPLHSFVVGGPLLDGLEFVDRDFSVTYRASLDPQLLRLRVSTAGPASKRVGPIVVRRILDLINGGAACGRLYLPEESRAERIFGPWNGADAFGPEYLWTLRVSGVCPEFMRLIVEISRKVGLEHRVLSMDVWGSLPPDGGVASATTSRVKQWLSDSRAYVPRCRAPSFDCSQDDGAHLRAALLRLNNKAGLGTQRAIEAVFAKWLLGSAVIVGADGRPVERHLDLVERMMPACEMTNEGLLVSLGDFPHAAAPAADMLINMLQRLNADIHAIDAVHLMIV